MRAEQRVSEEKKGQQEESTTSTQKLHHRRLPPLFAVKRIRQPLKQRGDEEPKAFFVCFIFHSFVNLKMLL